MPDDRQPIGRRREDAVVYFPCLRAVREDVHVRVVTIDELLTPVCCSNNVDSLDSGEDGGPTENPTRTKIGNCHGRTPCVPTAPRLARGPRCLRLPLRFMRGIFSSLLCRGLWSGSRRSVRRRCSPRCKRTHGLRRCFATQSRACPQSRRCGIEGCGGGGVCVAHMACGCRRHAVVPNSPCLAVVDAETEIARTQKNKATEYHLGQLKARLAKLRTEASTSCTVFCTNDHHVFENTPVTF